MVFLVLSEAHDLIESSGLRFILTGSSARKLRRQGVNLLAGRARTFNMHPLSVTEQQDAFNLRDSLLFGHLPPRFSDPDPAAYLRDYVQTYLREEVMQEELRAINDCHDHRYQIHFWRTQGGLEIDFVLYGPRGLLAIEIKRSTHIERKDTRALREFKKDYPPAQCFILYGGSVPLHMDGITALPLEQALKNLGQLLRGGDSV